MYYLSELEEMEKSELYDTIDELTNYPDTASETNPTYVNATTHKELVEIIMNLQISLANGNDITVYCNDEDDEDVVEDLFPVEDDNNDDGESCNRNISDETGGISGAAATVASSVNTATLEVKTTVYVQCGADSGNYPLVGKTVKNAMMFLAEVMGLGELRYPIVNGVEIGLEYILKKDDSLEFVKSAGEKG